MSIFAEEPGRLLLRVAKGYQNGEKMRLPFSMESTEQPLGDVWKSWEGAWKSIESPVGLHIGGREKGSLVVLQFLGDRKNQKAEKMGPRQQER